MESEKNGWKFYLGIVLFVYSFIPSICSTLLLLFDIPVSELLTFVVFVIATGYVAFFASIALLGKTIIAAIKSKLFSFLKFSSLGVDSFRISLFRHIVGIVLLVISFLPYFVVEILLFLEYPSGYDISYLLFYLIISGDIVFVISLFVLGSAFWGRLKDLFKWHPE
jgi:hypothetical protein